MVQAEEVADHQKIKTWVEACAGRTSGVAEIAGEGGDDMLGSDCVETDDAPEESSTDALLRPFGENVLVRLAPAEMKNGFARVVAR